MSRSNSTPALARSKSASSGAPIPENYIADGLASRLYPDKLASKRMIVQQPLSSATLNGKFSTGSLENAASTNRLRPKLLQTSQSVPSLRAASPNGGEYVENKTQRNVIINEESEKLQISTIDKVRSNISSSTNLLLQPESKFFNEKVSKLDSQLMKTYPQSPLITNDGILDIHGLNDSDDFNINAQKSSTANIPVAPAKTFLDSLKLSTKEIYDLMNIPRTFYYLKMRNMDASAYDLVTVSQDLIDKDNYSTISKEGKR
jgi:hypothetical protein